MKATIPVYYIVAIVFAIAIIATLGYWYFSTLSRSTTQFDESYCIAAYKNACSNKIVSSVDEFIEKEPACAKYTSALQKQEC